MRFKLLPAAILLALLICSSVVFAEPGPGFYLDMNYSYVFGNGSALIAPINGPVSSIARDSTMGGDFSLGYLFKKGLALQGGFEYLLRSEHIGVGYAASSGPKNDEWTITEEVAFLEPLYRLPLSRRTGLGAGIKLGFVFEDIAYGNHYGGLPSSHYSGTGLIYEPELFLQFLLGRHLGFNLKGGYRSDESGPVTDSRGRPLMAPDGKGGSETWRVVNSGMQLSAGFTIYFKPMY